MKTGISRLLRRCPLLAIFSAIPLPSLAQDYLNFSVPLLVETGSPKEGPAGSYSFTRTYPAHGFLGSDRSVAAVNGIGVPLGSTFGAEVAADAYQYMFLNELNSAPAGSESLDLASLKGVDITVGVWHRFSDNWTAEVAITQSRTDGAYEFLYVPLHEMLLPDGEILSASYEKFQVYSHLRTYSAGARYRVNDRIRAYAILGMTRKPYYTRQNNHFGFAAGIDWDITDRWRLELGLPRTTLGYRFLGGAYLYSGLVMSGNLSNPTQVPLLGSPQSTASDYQETDLSAGVLWNIGKGWKVDLSAGVPVSQTFGFR